jgi:hypothetical protein
MNDKTYAPPVLEGHAITVRAGHGRGARLPVFRVRCECKRLDFESSRLTLDEINLRVRTHHEVERNRARFGNLETAVG